LRGKRPTAFLRDPPSPVQHLLCDPADRSPQVATAGLVPAAALEPAAEAPLQHGIAYRPNRFRRLAMGKATMVAGCFVQLLQRGGRSIDIRPGRFEQRGLEHVEIVRRPERNSSDAHRRWFSGSSLPKADRVARSRRTATRI
jgi:hypothetical protein